LRRGRKRLWIRRLVHSPEGLVGVVLLAIMILLTVLGPRVVPYDPQEISFTDKLQHPSTHHWFGTDEAGRDMFSRVIIGTRISLVAAMVVIVLATAIGVPVGLMSGYLGGWTDHVGMRITDMFVGFPALILAIAVAAAIGPGLTNGMIAVSVVWWPGYARLMRGEVLALRSRLYVEAARALGVSDTRIIVRHILPNTLTPLIVKMTSDVGYAILYIASLGFIGLGAPPPLPEWGTMIADSRSYLLDYWWYPTFPGVALSLAVIAFNLSGDALQAAVNPAMAEAP
jgi:peptide/nickel transport system permease protein